jgi:hypothetical protein
MRTISQVGFKSVVATSPSSYHTSEKVCRFDSVCYQIHGEATETAKLHCKSTTQEDDWQKEEEREGRVASTGLW